METGKFLAPDANQSTWLSHPIIALKTSCPGKSFEGCPVYWKSNYAAFDQLVFSIGVDFE